MDGQLVQVCRPIGSSSELMILVGILRQEVADFLDQVMLRFIELFAFRALKILLGVGDVRIGALFRGGLRLWSELG